MARTIDDLLPLKLDENGKAVEAGKQFAEKRERVQTLFTDAAASPAASAARPGRRSRRGRSSRIITAWCAATTAGRSVWSRSGWGARGHED
jgi:hypothetical protein